MFPEGYKNPNSASPVLHGDGKSQADCDYEPKPSQAISNKQEGANHLIHWDEANIFNVYHNGLDLCAQG
jgi:hypothetical protein